MTLPADLLDRYDRQMRRDPPLPDGMTATEIGGVVRLTGLYNCIIHSDFAAEEAEDAVAREAAFFRATGQAVEWKVHAHDRPANLAQTLERHGFRPDPSETLVVTAIDDRITEAPSAEDVTVRHDFDDALLRDFRIAAAAAFGRPFPDSDDDLKAQAAAGILSLHVVYAEGRPVAASRVEIHPGREFAGLYTGGVAPDWRGRGIYRAMVRSRAREAARRGCRYLVAEALPTSRPILERLGFTPLTTVQGWILEP